MGVSRRTFLSTAGAAAAGSALPSRLFAEGGEAPGEFRFLFITDTHLQPELDAAKGCAMAFRKASGLHADFTIQGGDHIMDALAVPESRSLPLFRQYAETEQQLGMKVYHTIGNHDVIGLYPASGIAPADPLYGKRYFEEHIGRLYQSFDYKGVRFFVLDSIGITPDRAYEGRIDPPQLAWFRAELAKTPAEMPVIVVTHIPLVTAADGYTAPPATPAAHHGLSVVNASEVLPLFEGRNVLGVLQGHNHWNERVEWRGVPYITSGAVCGNWWKGVRLGTPEGFTVCTVRDGRLETRYETYGFHAVAQG